MIHILVDEGEIVSALSNVDTETISWARSACDESFRRWVDTHPFDVAERMCRDLGIPFSPSIEGYNDVLVALLIDCGATEVDYMSHHTVADEDESYDR